MKTTILRPALHTLWQAFTAALALWFAGAGLTGWHAVHSFSDLQRFAISAALAVLAALASALFHTARLYLPRIVRAEFRDDPVAVAVVNAAIDEADRLAAPLDAAIAKLFPAGVPPAGGAAAVQVVPVVAP